MGPPHIKKMNYSHDRNGGLNLFSLLLKSCHVEIKKYFFLSFFFYVHSWPGLPAALPSPASPSAVIVSPETLSRHSSSSPSRAHRPVAQLALALPCPSQPIPAVCYPAPAYLEVADGPVRNLGA